MCGGKFNIGISVSNFLSHGDEFCLACGTIRAERWVGIIAGEDLHDAEGEAGLWLVPDEPLSPFGHGPVVNRCGAASGGYHLFERTNEDYDDGYPVFTFS